MVKNIFGKSDYSSLRDFFIVELHIFVFCHGFLEISKR